MTKQGVLDFYFKKRMSDGRKVYSSPREAYQLIVPDNFQTAIWPDHLEVAISTEEIPGQVEEDRPKYL